MPEKNVSITEDMKYKPSSPEMPDRRFIIETEAFKWVVDVRKYVIKETGTAVYFAKAGDEGHAAYGLTVNEVLNDLKSIMLTKLGAPVKKTRTVSLEAVRPYLDPTDAAREDIKFAQSLSSKTFLARLFGL